MKNKVRTHIKANKSRGQILGTTKKVDCATDADCTKKDGDKKVDQDSSFGNQIVMSAIISIFVLGLCVYQFRPKKEEEEVPTE